MTNIEKSKRCSNWTQLLLSLIIDVPKEDDATDENVAKTIEETDKESNKPNESVQNSA